jgi:plastocyanin
VARARRRSPLLALGLSAALVGAACAGGGSGHATRTVLVDFAHDEMQTSMIDFFPRTVSVHPGDSVDFRQFWTGEAHNVTFGTVFNDALGRIRQRLDRSPRPTVSELAADLAVLSPLPSILGTNGPFAVNQNGAQPCFLEKGLPPADAQQPCPRRTQPAFTGRESYYSSGFIHHVGKGANRFSMRLAADIAPGSYHYYCTLHGVGQSGTIVVAPPGRAVPSQSEVSRQAQTAVERDFAAPLRRATTQAAEGSLTIANTAYRPPLAGVAADGIRSWTGVAHQRHFEHRHGSVNQFVPATVRTRAGQPVTWTFAGRHTVSFNVPKFFPIFSVAPSGHVDINPAAFQSAGFPGRPPNLAPTQNATVDAGTWDGKGFRSSGLDWIAGDKFTVAFRDPGTYLLACLVHPGMVGKVVVEA